MMNQKKRKLKAKQARNQENRFLLSDTIPQKRTMGVSMKMLALGLAITGACSAMVLGLSDSVLASELGRDNMIPTSYPAISMTAYGTNNEQMLLSFSRYEQQLKGITFNASLKISEASLKELENKSAAQAEPDKLGSLNDLTNKLDTGSSNEMKSMLSQ